jgi:hypothetical protein
VTGCQPNDLSNHLNPFIPLFSNSVHGAGSKSLSKNYYAEYQHVIIVDADQYFFWDQTGIAIPGQKNYDLACSLLLLYDCQFYMGDKIYHEKMEGNA